MVKIVLIFFTVFLQFSCNNTITIKNNVSINKTDTGIVKQELTSKNISTEHWSWENATSTFELDLIRSGNSITGKYCAVAHSGNRIDCSDDTLSNYLSGTKIENAYVVSFNSSFDDELKRDTALLTYNTKAKTLLWVRKTTHIVSYVPYKAILR